MISTRSVVTKVSTGVSVALLGITIGVVLLSCSTNEYPSSQALVQGTNTLPPPDVTSLEQLQSSFRYVAETALPSVVRIDVRERVAAASEGGFPLFEFFFGQSDDQPPRSDGFESRGVGSGVVIGTDSGRYYVLTNNHVVGEADSIMVILNDESEYEASLVGRDSRKDLALVQFASDQEIPVARLGDSDTLRVGDWVVAIGSPFGYRNTVTVGIVSALGRQGGPGGNISDFIQTDAAINQGNSGGALVNLDGEVVGINTWITSDSGGNIGLGFAMPINNVIRSVESILESGTVEYGWLGISIENIGSSYMSELRLPVRAGAFITSVFSASPADVSRILPGDFIVTVGGERIRNTNELILLVGEIPVGVDSEIELYRQGKLIETTVTIAARQNDASIQQMDRRRWPGFSVFPLTDQVVTELELGRRRGVIVSDVDRRTPGDIAGIRTYDVVKQVNGIAIAGILAFYEALNNANSDQLDIVVIRDGQELTVTLER